MPRWTSANPAHQKTHCPPNWRANWPKSACCNASVSRRYHVGAKVNGVLTADVMSSTKDRQITNLIYPTNPPDHDLRLRTHRHRVRAEGRLGILGSNRHLGFSGDWPAAFRPRM